MTGQGRQVVLLALIASASGNPLMTPLPEPPRANPQSLFKIYLGGQTSGKVRCRQFLEPHQDIISSHDDVSLLEKDRKADRYEIANKHSQKESKDTEGENSKSSESLRARIGSRKKNNKIERLKFSMA